MHDAQLIRWFIYQLQFDYVHISNLFSNGIHRVIERINIDQIWPILIKVQNTISILLLYILGQFIVNPGGLWLRRNNGVSNMGLITLGCLYNSPSTFLWVTRLVPKLVLFSIRSNKSRESSVRLIMCVDILNALDFCEKPQIG